RANFSPGKLDGHYGDFTWKALALYRISRGEQPQQPPPQVKSKGNIAPDINGLDLASVEPVFITYTVTDADLQSVGPSPSGVAAHPANDSEEQAEQQNRNAAKNKESSTTNLVVADVSEKLDTNSSIREVHDDDKLVATYRSTIGSADPASRMGEWKVSKIT